MFRKGLTFLFVFLGLLVFIIGEESVFVALVLMGLGIMLWPNFSLLPRQILEGGLKKVTERKSKSKTRHFCLVERVAEEVLEEEVVKMWKQCLKPATLHMKVYQRRLDGQISPFKERLIPCCEDHHPNEVFGFLGKLAHETRAFLHKHGLYWKEILEGKEEQDPPPPQ